MATIPTTYTYTDGNVLVPSDHNSNIYSGTGNTGIMSEPNGGLDNNNLNASFEVQSEHIWPEEVVRMRQESYSDDSDYMSDALGSDASTGFFTVSGLSARIYLPYAVTYGLWTWSYYFSAWRYIDDAKAAADQSPGIAMRTLVNGSHTGFEHTQRRVPPTIHVDIAPAPDTALSREGTCAMWRSQSHLDDVGMAKGWHELDIRMTMESQDDSFPLADLNAAAQSHRFYTRVTFGMRNVNFIGFL